MPGMDKLPIEMQIVFWFVFIMLSALCGLVVYWTKRYIDSQDERLKDHEKILSSLSKKLSDTTAEMKTITVSMKGEFSFFRKDVEQSMLRYKDEIHLLNRELSTAQTRMIVIGEESGKLYKNTESIASVLRSELPMVRENQGKIQVLEQTQQKIVTIVQKLSEKVLKISSKPEDK
jgi:hypothetical protein